LSVIIEIENRWVSSTSQKREKKLKRGGVGSLSLSKIEEYFKNNSDQDNILLQEKISRYLDLKKLYKKLGTAIQKDGATITVENGNQKFTKVNPAIPEKEKLNTQLLNLENEIFKTIKLTQNTIENHAQNAPSSNSKGGLV
jgi:hypothetical protein